MKKISVFSFALLSCVWAKSQQIEQFSMYMENNYLINPAEAGTTDYVDVKLGYRNQWSHLDGAPNTYFFSVHTPIFKKRNDVKDVTPLPYHGIGMALIGDVIGPFNRSTMKVSYSYQRPLNQKWIVSGGVHAGFQQYKFDSDLLVNVRDRSNLFASQPTGQATLPDLSLGLWAHTHNFYIGFASFQLIPGDLDINYSANGNDGQLKPHHWLTSGVRIPLDKLEHFNFVPSFAAKKVTGAPVQVDINAKVHYQDHAWVGLSYRNKDALVTIVGVTMKKKIDVAYSYDWTFQNSRRLNNNTHEILLGFRLPNHPHEPAPPPFW